MACSRARARVDDRAGKRPGDHVAVGARRGQFEPAADRGSRQQHRADHGHARCVPRANRGRSARARAGARATGRLRQADELAQVERAPVPLADPGARRLPDLGLRDDRLPAEVVLRGVLVPAVGRRPPGDDHCHGRHRSPRRRGLEFARDRAPALALRALVCRPPHCVRGNRARLLPPDPDGKPGVRPGVEGVLEPPLRRHAGPDRLADRGAVHQRLPAPSEDLGGRPGGPRGRSRSDRWPSARQDAGVPGQFFIWRFLRAASGGRRCPSRSRRRRTGSRSGSRSRISATTRRK